MKVLEILEKVCVYLDLTDEFETVLNEEGFPPEILNDFDKIMLAINNTCESLSYKFLNFKTTEEVSFSSHLIEVKNLSKKAIEILSVKNKQGEKLPFKVYDGKIECNTTCALVTYVYSPKHVINLREEVLVDLRVSLSTFALGVVSEYFYINGLLDDYNVYKEKYLNALTECLKKGKVHLPKRRWF